MTGFYYLGIGMADIAASRHAEFMLEVVFMGAMTTLTLLLTTLVFSICNFMGIYLDRDTILISFVVVALIDFSVVMLIMKYIKNHVIYSSLK